ncbi:hypothetical protein ABGB09_01600 [Streptomyces sp. B8F3]|uniref:hypothetical protein n=1 Tax=Streptomyces sp. B8F3 TaxID=3153573 RepID=UPI00325EC3E8
MASDHRTDGMPDYLTRTAEMCQGVDSNDPRYAEYHNNMNEVLDELYPEGGSNGQNK